MTRSWQADAVGPPPKRPTLIEEWKAEIAGLRAAWEQAVAERDAAKAEIARLQRENSDLNHNIVGMRSSNTSLVAERDEAKAEIARLTAENQKFKALIASETAWLRSLQPDTGEQPSPLQAIADILKPFTFKGVKPDTGETP
jgi:chromosome segregation ATPase